MVPRPTGLSGINRDGNQLVKRLIGLALTVSLAVVPAVAGAAPAAQHNAKKPTKGTSAKAVNATFGAAPASAKGPDGRPYFTFDVTPGGDLSDHLAITNYANKPETLSVYPVDATPALNGAISFPEQSAPRTAVGAWMAVGTLNANGQITLKPRSVSIVPVEIKVPTNAPPGDHVGAVVVSLAGRVASSFGSGGKQNVKFDQRIAVRAAFRVAGAIQSSLTIQGLKAKYHGPIDPFAKGYTQVSYVVHNGGNDVLGGPQSVSVHGMFGQREVGPKLTGIPPLLPGASYPVTVRVPAVYPELYMSATVTVIPQGLQGEIDPGLHPVTSTVHFLAIPWIVVIVLLILILGLALGYWRRRRRKRKATSTTGRHRDGPTAEVQPTVQVSPVAVQHDPQTPGTPEPQGVAT
jgi:Bacterial protein of unknown function (DUF916)